jgi:hypothetical protein
MGIYTLKAHKLDRILEVKGRFWIVAQMRSYEFEWTSYDLNVDPRPQMLRKQYRIPYNLRQMQDGIYEAWIIGDKKIDDTTITKEQAYFIENVIEKYLLQSSEDNRERFLVDV